ncbi:lipid A biosynthesis lauroyl acyltransferase [soil metagenome]
MNQPHPKKLPTLFSKFFLQVSLCALWPVAQLPFKLQLKIGHCIGLLMLRYAKRLRTVATININLCFPHLSDTQRQDLLKKNFLSLGIGVMESLMAWLATEERIKPLLHLHGKEHLDHALSQKKGIIVLGAHFTTLPIISRLSTQVMPVAVMHRRQRKPLLDELVRKNYEKHHVKAILREDVRGMLTCLKQKTSVWYTPDVDAGPKKSVFVPFFGISTATVTAVSRFAELADAVVMPVAFYRRADGKGYDMHIQPILSNFPSGDPKQDAARINQIVEMAVMKHPEQYLWQYKRFKTRPPGEVLFYPNKRGEFKVQPLN